MLFYTNKRLYQLLLGHFLSLESLSFLLLHFVLFLVVCVQLNMFLNAPNSTNSLHLV